MREKRNTQELNAREKGGVGGAKTEHRCMMHQMMYDPTENEVVCKNI
jgi:hypothetical protein